mmetsp:Transcript_24423/g.60027  ORF Transcript_24423/g.60027 Transcript_24423/m.60027 type:complete len:204 (+) Transcript_24423:248-859(+)
MMNVNMVTTPTPAPQQQSTPQSGGAFSGNDAFGGGVGGGGAAGMTGASAASSTIAASAFDVFGAGLSGGLVPQQQQQRPQQQQQQQGFGDFGGDAFGDSISGAGGTGGYSIATSAFDAFCAGPSGGLMPPQQQQQQQHHQQGFGDFGGGVFGGTVQGAGGTGGYLSSPGLAPSPVAVAVYHQPAAFAATDFGSLTPSGFSWRR